MKTSWIGTTVGEQATLQRGIDITQKRQTAGPVPVISSGGISSFHNIAAVSGPGVVLGRKGTVGTVFYVESDFWPHDTTLWVKDFHGNDRRFVYYFFRSIARTLCALDVGTANPTLNRNHVHPLQVEWPTLAEQRTIVDILGAIDDKIELNRRMNQTLESMARAIFRSWFVDFDPVVAKAAGRQPFGMLADVAALFPDRFVDSAIGAIPGGWSTRSVYEFAHFVNGAAFKGSHFSPDRSGLPIIKIAELKHGITEQTQFTTQCHEEKNRLAAGDILFSWSGSPETSIGTFVWSGGAGWLNQHIFRVSPNRKEDELFVYYTLLYLNDEFVEIARNKQTTGLGHVTVADLKRRLVVVPPDNALAAFNSAARPLYEKWCGTTLESRTLAVLRDTLLPKLMSGELRVRDAENLAGTHV